jgi:hypothetical protein
MPITSGTKVSMRQGTRELIEALNAAATMNELAARDVVSAAETVARAGSPAAARTLRALGAIHERKAAEARSQAALLAKRNGQAFT